ncbi:hypothetical protein [Nonomuraea sp. NPDC050643]
MTAAERWTAAYMTAGLSVRVSELDALDAADYTDWFVPPQRTPTP